MATWRGKPLPSGTKPLPVFILLCISPSLAQCLVPGRLSLMMSIGCLRSSPETAEHILNEQDLHYISMKLNVEHGGAQLGQTPNHEPPTPEPPRDGPGQGKPRRKDTPILNPLPLIPGVRQLKGEKHLIHQEDEEKEDKN